MSKLSNTKVLREYKKIAKRLGVKIVNTTVNGHYHLIMEKNGVRKLFIAARTPSDMRATANMEAHLKRWVRELRT